VTLSGLAGGEYLPLPASKGLAFPFLLTFDGYPTSPAIYAQGQRFSPKIKETPGKEPLKRGVKATGALRLRSVARDLRREAKG